MDALTGTNYANVKTGRTVVKSVLVTAPLADPAVIQLYDYNDTAADPRLTVRASDNTTQQVFFNGLVFESGLSIVPSAETVCYVIEYE